ncbi:MAG: hypothetical protein KatS3mg102_2818 [Planctomycetota bacterium]|nr:MAG: hypothetical protein KatS3mg102_2818 [Planctomycetota bacterium]
MWLCGGERTAAANRRGSARPALAVTAVLASAGLFVACGGGGGGGGGVGADTIARFTAVLGNPPTDPSQPGLGLANAPELTDVLNALSNLPVVEVQIDTETPEEWWICIWEIDDRIHNEKYTVGAAISRDRSDPDYLVWLSPEIGPQTTELDMQSSTAAGTAGLVLQEDNTFFAGISPDTAGDQYHVVSSTPTGQTVYVSACKTDSNTGMQYHYTAQKVDIDFALSSKFEDAGSPPLAHQGAIPPGALTQTTGAVPSLRITYEAGCP